MTQEQKAKAYDEALEKARQLCLYPTTKPFINDLQDIFPELKESEDEKIRKNIIVTIHLYYGEPLEDEAKEMIAWLENQGEQKPSDEDMKEALRTEYEKGRADAIAEMEKPTWSVGDMSKVQRICMYLNEAKKYYADITEVRECINWLKSLKDRFTWKPSDEQIEVLEIIRKILHADKDIYSKANNLMYNFEELIRTLKKLREE